MQLNAQVLKDAKTRVSEVTITEETGISEMAEKLAYLYSKVHGGSIMRCIRDSALPSKLTREELEDVKGMIAALVTSAFLTGMEVVKPGVCAEITVEESRPVDPLMELVEMMFGGRGRADVQIVSLDQLLGGAKRPRE